MSTQALLRVTQLDAINFDNEIYKSLVNIFKECSNHLPPGFIAKYEPEIFLLIKLFLLKYSIFEDGTTFGQKLVAIKYQHMSYPKRVLYTILTNLGYVKDRFEGLPISRNLSDRIKRLDSFVQLCSFINLSVFLRTGKMPLLVDRLLGLEQVYSRNVHRKPQSKYMTRELLWNGFIEVLVYVLPLVNYHKVKRIARNINPFCKKLKSVSFGERVLNAQTICAHCKMSPIIPHHMGCSHIFCFTCLSSNQYADSKYECPVCEFRPEKPICERIVMNR